VDGTKNPRWGGGPNNNDEAFVELAKQVPIVGGSLQEERGAFEDEA
jgi:hypothetical protein